MPIDEDLQIKKQKQMWNNEWSLLNVKKIFVDETETDVDATIFHCLYLLHLAKSSG